MSRRRFKRAELYPAPPGRRCAYCWAPLPRRRRRFCSPACVQAVEIVCEERAQYAAIETRDRGICRACHLDTARLRSVLFHCSHETRLAVLVELELFHPRRPRLWHLDHLLPVALGGGARPGIRLHEFLANLQTLCRRCHAAKTRLDHQAIRAARSSQGGLPVGRSSPAQDRQEPGQTLGAVPRNWPAWPGSTTRTAKRAQRPRIARGAILASGQ